ncbi:MAG: ribonucleoside-diphosphate reductase, adenosylcobalamin-dependent [Deltaproteobacteria bacterium RBG_16_71_12]|nr:MAG: ribonucleoside-diphosphate reductase, adenosylcobalamin-dependent [Deltaproteobacteria bacterium RBG_16_71_12]
MRGVAPAGVPAAPRPAPVLQASPQGVRVPRRDTREGVDPMSEAAGIAWERRSASITDANGKALFKQDDIEVPAGWSQQATNIVANKYFRGTIGAPDRETSVRQLVLRVVDTLTGWGRRRRYFATEADAEAFRDELAHLLVTQKVAFNSPVWFNVGVEPHPQCSACFINSVDDTMESILTLARTEGMLFKYGSGAGSNLSAIRSSRELLAGGGTASGPVSFMRGFDAFAGVIKSGGKTRRAAKMVILNAEHPDIVDFIDSKMTEEKKAWALIEAGYDGGFNVSGGAYDSVFFQNANHSVRVTDTFMRAVVEGKTYFTKAVRNGAPMDELQARSVWRKMAEAAWLCGDPGVQFDSTINRWHTCKATAPIHASNPCSEYMFLDDSACNLASFNLMKYRRPDGTFDVEAFRHAVQVLILSMEIIIDDSKYPTDRIAKNSHDFRPLGLGYANLGALLMASGLPYDSEDGRAAAAAITALLGGEAYAASAEVAKAKGPFAGYTKNRDGMLGVMQLHRAAAFDVDKAKVPEAFRAVLDASRDAWTTACEVGEKHGFRNAQTTVLAPTGTIGFMMDCDTTGIEPDIALVKYKKLVGGGLMKIVNTTVPLALDALGYSAAERSQILHFIEEHETIEGAPWLKPEHLPVFDCAFRPAKGSRSIAPMGHVRMMAAAQPFLSGAISKTVNMPESTTVEEIEQIYLDAWKLGLKAIAIYRDNCKRSQPLSTSRKDATRDAKGDAATGMQLPTKALLEQGLTAEEVMAAVTDPSELTKLRQRLSVVTRRKLADERAAITHKFSISGHEGYLTVGLFEDGQPGELFCTMSKEGSTISGLMDAFATAISLALQYGVPLRVLVDKFSHMRFEPSGFTGNQQVPIAKSVCDYIFRWLGLKFLPADERPFDPSAAQAEMFVPASGERASVAVEPKALAAAVTSVRPAGFRAHEHRTFVTQADAPACPSCGSITVRCGACYKCENCGATTGCG